jgi:hypothetical protein
MSGKSKSGKTVVANRLLSDFKILPMVPANRAAAKKAMFLQNATKDAIILDEVHYPIPSDVPKLQNSSLSGVKYIRLPHSVSVVQKYANGAPTGLTFTYTIGPQNLARTYRRLYNQASLRKKIYLKTISKTHTLEECIKHARKVRF